MRAAIVREFAAADALRVEQVDAPSPDAGELLIDIKATGINFVDSLVVSGKYQFLPARPFVPGKLPVGVVSGVGKGCVGPFANGDRVLTLLEQGGYGQQVVAPEHVCFKLPDRMTFVEAASMALAYDTAWFALRERARATRGEVVLVLGASGAVGHAAMQLAKAYGLRVLAGVSGPHAAPGVLAAGADAVVDLSKPNLRESLREQVYELNEGRGVDIVIDPLGADVFDAALRAIAWRGRIVVVGFAAGRIPEVKVNYLMLKNIEVSGLQVSDYRKKAPEEMAHCLAEVFRLYDAGQVRPKNATPVLLDDVGATLAALAQRKISGRFVMTNP
jgi:NADPH2:quinone reductase